MRSPGSMVNLGRLRELRRGHGQDGIERLPSDSADDLEAVTSGRRASAD